MVKYINILPSDFALIFSMRAGAEAARGNEQPAALFGSAGIFTSISNILLFAVGAIAVLMIIIAGLRYITSAGNSSAISAAKNTILYAIIGLIIAILAYAIVHFVVNSFASEAGVNDAFSGTGAAQSTDLPTTGGV